MSRTARLIGRRLGYAAAGAAIVAWAPVTRPAPRIDLLSAVVAGALVGTAAFVVLARSLPPLGRPVVARGVALVAPVVVLGAAGEEAVWRFGVLQSLEPAFGASTAVTISTIGFAAAHLGRTPVHALPVHLVTGSAFASAYLATGRLAAAVAAHAVYNLLVVAACAASLAEEAVV
jgi:membrane protease YdiL (CAAX protease family)